MLFAAPVWLIGLLPWAAVVVYLLRGRHPQARVPFLDFWRGPVQPATKRRATRLPSLPVLLALLAILCAIVASAGPVLKFIPAKQGPRITVIVDRGITMSALSDGEPRWKRLVQAAREPILSQFGLGPTDLVLLPAAQRIETDRLGWFVRAERDEPAPADTRTQLPQVVARALAAHDGPVVVLSDQQLTDQSDRLIQISPRDSVRNVGIVSASATRRPHMQVMLRIRNDSPNSSAAVRLSSASDTVVRQIDLPRSGTEANYFLDMTEPSDVVHVELDIDDDQPLDNRASLRQAGAWPRIAAGADLPAEVRRVIDTYQKHRPASPSSRDVAVTSELSSSQVPAAIVATGNERVAVAAVASASHPILQHVDWESSLGSSLYVATAPADGWSPVATMGDHVLLAVREAPARQVWVGFRSETLPRTADFVVLWSNILNWIGESEEVFRAELIPAVPSPPVFSTDWQEKMAALPATQQAGRDVSSVLLLGALALILGSVWTWSTCKNCAAG